jgi:hypothetical protein
MVLSGIFSDLGWRDFASQFSDLSAEMVFHFFDPSFQLFDPPGLLLDDTLELRLPTGNYICL